jgi:hypothetical protein
MRCLGLISAALLLACSSANTDTSTIDTPPTTKPAPSGGETNHGQPPGAPAPSSRATWCSDKANGSHSFCADFDGDDPLGDWDDAVRGTDRKHEDGDEVASPARSGKGALHLRGADIERNPDADPLVDWSGMFLTKKLPVTTSTKATIAFDLFVATNDEIIGVVELSGRTSTQDIALNLRLDLTRDASFLGAALGDIPKLPPIENGKWVRVQIEIDGATATLSYDGAEAGSTKFDGDFATSVETTLYLGVSRSAPSGAYDVRYDDVVVDLYP